MNSSIIDGLTLTDVQLSKLTTIMAEIDRSAPRLVRNRLEDTAVRAMRARSWCEEADSKLVPVLGRPRATGWEVTQRQRGRKHVFVDSDGNDCLGYSVDGWRNGRDAEGYDREGYDEYGYSREGLDKEGRSIYRFHPTTGFDPDGFNIRGLDKDGFNREGFNRYGYDREGFNAQGVNRNGYGRDGFNPTTNLDANGYDREGMDRFGRARYVFDNAGVDANGYDTAGWSRHGFDQLPVVRN